MIILYRNKGNATLQIAKVSKAYYEEKIYSDSDIDGLIICTSSGNLLYENISKEESDRIIWELYEKEKIDLSKYELITF